MRLKLEQGVAPDRIGFVSFTRKAVEEARGRAGQAFGLTPKDLPYFKTLHALGFWALGMTSNDVMSSADWKDFGGSLGMDITGLDNRLPDEGTLIPQATAHGDRYVSMIERAKMRCVSLEQEFSDAGNWNLSLPMLKRVDQALGLYKSAFGKVSFIDMLEMYVNQGPRPVLDLLIIDEAQDLTPLQWRMANAIAERAHEVVIAGDDDQCIHRWAGVDVQLFMESAADRRVLSQSYRLTPEVQELSHRIVSRISRRLEKPFRPTDRTGSVTQLIGPHSLDVSEGSWTIMGRTNKFAFDWGKRLRDAGYYYLLNGTPSVKRELASAIHALRTLQAGGALRPPQIKSLYEALPKQGQGAALRRGATKLLEALDPEGQYDYEALVQSVGFAAPKDQDPMTTLRVGSDIAEYIRSLERRGEDLLAVPRIKVSTIHAMKGGEDENVAVDLSSTKACAASPFPDDEHRTFYVGVTRAKRNLYLINSDKEYRYVI